MQTLVKGNTEFSLDLYAQLRDREGNLFLSPYSISTALTMTYAGARGKTAEQMAEVLNSPFEPERLHRAFDRLGSQLNAVEESEDIQLRLANALWVQEGYPLLDQFVQVVTKHYRAEVKESNFREAYDAVRKEINAWVEDHTEDKIKELIKPGTLNALTRLVLVNAIYFKGNWENPFMEEATKEASFHVSPDRSVQVPMMSQEGRFKYGEKEGLQILELPYTTGHLSMFVLLPKETDGLIRLEESLTRERLESWMTDLQSQSVMVELPRFKTTSQFNLADMLSAMGMSAAFRADEADFSGIDGATRLYISAVLHKAFVEVNEEGTEAAAATGVVVGLTAAPSPPRVFRADHPFLFLIRDHQTGSLLFFGRILDPTE